MAYVVLADGSYTEYQGFSASDPIFQYVQLPAGAMVMNNLPPVVDVPTAPASPVSTPESLAPSAPSGSVPPAHGDVSPVNVVPSAVLAMSSPMQATAEPLSVSDPGFEQSYAAYKAGFGDSYDIGQVRFSSPELENGPSGIRIGTISRIVIASDVEGFS